MVDELRIGGPVTVDSAAERWDEKADELEFEALEKARGTGEKWAASITATLGAFTAVALVKGPDDISKLEQLWSIVVGVLVAAAFVTAITAIYLAALAAQGTPRELVLPTGDRLRRWTEEQLPIVGKQLMDSRKLAIAAAVLAMIAVGVTWYAPTEKAPAKPTTVLVIPKTGPAVCGALKSTRAGQLTVKPKQGPAAVVPTADVIDLSSVTTCP